MLIPIKQIIQEGYSYEDILQTIEEALISSDNHNPEEITESIKNMILGAAMLGTLGTGIGYDKASNYFPNYAKTQVNQQFVDNNKKWLDREKQGLGHDRSDVGSLTVWGNGKLPEMIRTEYNKNGNPNIEKTKELVDKSGWVNNKIAQGAAAGGLLGMAAGGLLGARRIKQTVKNTPKAISHISSSIGAKTAPLAEKLVKKYDATNRLNNINNIRKTK